MSEDEKKYIVRSLEGEKSDEKPSVGGRLGTHYSDMINPLRPTTIQKLLEMSRVRLYPQLLVATALDSDIN